MITYPRFTYGTSPINLDFAVLPFSAEYISETITGEAFAPGADVGSDTEYVANYILTNNYIYLQVNLVVEADTNADIDDFWAWWAFAKTGKEFTFYPDKDSLGTSFTVIEAMGGKFKPKPKDGLYSFLLILQVPP